MRLGQAGELSLVEGIRARFRSTSQSVLKGIGDDCAVLAPGSGKLLATTDLMAEGVHFDMRYITPYQLGFKLVSANVSDIYSMGGTPAHMLLALALPQKVETTFLDRLLDGIQAALARYKVSLVGGDISTAQGKAILSATLFGTTERPVYRSGARPGDPIYVTGPLGDSAAGLELLKRIQRPVDLEQPRHRPFTWSVMRPLLTRHLMPEARKPGAIAKHATAMIDISDGLFLDLWRLTTESGVGARIYEERLPMTKQMCQAADSMGLNPLALATSGGEDYELLFTAPKGVRVRGMRIGEITTKGLTLVRPGGDEEPITPKGYRHFG